MFEYSDAYCRKQQSLATVFFRLAVQFLCLKMCVFGGSAVPSGGVGDRLP